MGGRRLLWQLYLSYLFIFLAALVAIGWIASRQMRTFYLDHLAADLEARAILVSGRIRGRSGLDNARSVDALCKKLEQEISTRITVIAPSGLVIGDSHEDPAAMGNHVGSDRPEIMRALDGEPGIETRYSETLQRNMMYVAVPLREDAKIIAVVRMSLPLDRIQGTLRSIYAQIGTGLLVTAALLAVISLLISRRISRPLEELKSSADRFARGELDRRLSVSGIAEIAGVAESMNHMAAQLGERIRTITQQRNEQEAILASMVEGVLAVDDRERVVGVNQACARVLEIDPDAARGRSIHEVVRNPDLQAFVRRVLASAEPVEGDVVLQGTEECFLQAHGAILRDATGTGAGAVVVLNDVTRLRRLGTVRRDFVANVSHELRTPLTPIKVAVETLLEGALREGEKAEHFLDIISRQADRLGAIINDLLDLSRIEEEEKQGVPLERGVIEPVLRAAIQACSAKAREKNIRVDLNCQEKAQASVNSQLLENAVVNLIDNAVKYSEPGSAVQVEAEGTDGGVVIRVRDTGCGIGKRHLPRLFERFYRVDKARSRKLGGTGLGLAIVKHIVRAHGGRVSVESKPSEGSTFTIHLPATASPQGSDGNI